MMETITIGGYTVALPDDARRWPEQRRKHWIASERNRQRLEAVHAWAEPLGLKEAGGMVMVARLWGRTGQKWYDVVPPYNDHASLWNFAGKPACYVYQPYDLDVAGREEEIRYFAACHGLICYIGDYPAWYYPGMVKHVELWRPDQYERAMEHARQWVERRATEIHLLRESITTGRGHDGETMLVHQ